MSTILKRAISGLKPDSNWSKRVVSRGLAVGGGLTGPGGVISGVIAWYKADALSLSDTNPVSSWLDSSGNGNTLVQGTGTNQPLYRTGIVNGLPVVRFDNSNDFLSVSSPVGLGGATGISILAVIEHAAPGIGNFKMLMCLNSGANELRLFGFAVTPRWEMPGPGGTAVAFIDRAAGFGRLSAIFTDSSNDISIWLNTVAGTSTTDATGLSMDRIFMGARDGSAHFFGGDIAELAIYGRAINSTERGNIESYFASKYAI